MNMRFGGLPLKFIAAGFGIAWLLAIYWMFLDELRPVDRLTEDTYISMTRYGPPVTEIAAGSVIYMVWNYHRLRRCQPDFQPKFVNTDTKEVIFLQEHHGLGPDVLGDITLPEKMQLPALMEPGPWEYQLKVSFKCNPLEPQIIIYPAVPLSIVPGVPVT